MTRVAVHPFEENNPLQRQHCWHWVQVCHGAHRSREASSAWVCADGLAQRTAAAEKEASEQERETERQSHAAEVAALHERLASGEGQGDATQRGGVAVSPFAEHHAQWGQQLEERAQQVSALGEANQQLQLELEQAYLQLQEADAQADAAAQMDPLQDELRQLRAQAAQASRADDDRVATLKDMQIRLANTEAAANQKQAQLDELQQGMALRTAEAAEHCTQAADRVASLEAEVQRLRQQSGESTPTQQAAQAEARAQELAAQLAVKDAAITSLQSQLQSVQQQLEGSQQALAALQGQVTEQAEQLAAASHSEHDLAAVQQQMHELQGQAAEGQAALTAALEETQVAADAQRRAHLAASQQIDQLQQVRAHCSNRQPCAGVPQGVWELDSGVIKMAVMLLLMRHRLVGERKPTTPAPPGFAH